VAWMNVLQVISDPRTGASPRRLETLVNIDMIVRFIDHGNTVVVVTSDGHDFEIEDTMDSVIETLRAAKAEK
jgi:excinuclease UvrABC ATPase subunit